MSDPIFDALNAATQRGAAPAPGQAMSAPAAVSDPILSALQSRAVQADPAPAPPRTFMQQIGDFASATEHHLEKLPAGMAQLAMHGNQQQWGLIAPYLPQWMNDAYKQTYGALGDTLDHQINDREVAYQKSTPDSAGSYAGATVGEVAPFLLAGPQRALAKIDSYVGSKVAPVLPQAVSKVGAKVAGGAAQGATVGAVQPVVNPPTLSDLVTGNQPPSFMDQKLGQVAGGAAFGGAVPAVTSTAGALVNAGKRFVAPVVNPSGYAAQQVANQLGADAHAIAGDLSSAPQHVPGSVPTSAQAAADPRLVMIEKALANQNPAFKAKLIARENANNAARLQAVSQVAQTPQALDAAVAQREAVTGPMRDFAVTNGNPVPVAGINDALSSVAQGPLGVAPTIGGAARNMQSDLGDMTNVTPPNTVTNAPGSATASPAMLDALRQNANDYLSKFAPNGAVGTKEQAAMTPVKQAIVQAIDEANPGHKLGTGGWGQGIEQAGPVAPGYRDYLTEFAKRSVPVNTMQVGQDLEGKLLANALNSSGDPAATLPGYRSALAKALRETDYPIDPQAQKALEAVQSDLQRATISSSVRAPGSDTAYNAGAGTAFLRALGAGPEGNGKAAAAAAATLATTGSPKLAGGAAFGTKKAGDFIANRVGNALGDLMLDPQKLAQALMVGSQPLEDAAPTAFSQLGGRLTFAARNALLGELLKRQAAQVVGADAQPAYAN